MPPKIKVAGLRERPAKSADVHLFRVYLVSFLWSKTNTLISKIYTSVGSLRPKSADHKSGRQKGGVKIADDNLAERHKSGGTLARETKERLPHARSVT